MAAGEGLRMRPLTNVTPKPMLDVQGKTLLSHQIDFLKNHVDSIAVTVGYMFDKVAACALENGAHYIFNNGNGANANWLNSTLVREIDTQILVITCDNLMEVDLNQIERESLATPRLNYLVTRECGLEFEGDRIIQTHGQVDAVSPLSDSKTLATGLQVINPGTLHSNVKFTSFHEVWSELIVSKSLFVSESHPIKWTAIDTPLDLENANKGW